MREAITCPKCGREATYDPESTLYLKCMGCDFILISDVNDTHNEAHIVIDYGIGADGMTWVKTLGEDGKSLTYRKKL